MLLHYPEYEEMQEIKERTSTAKYSAFVISIQDNVEARGNVLSGSNIYGTTEDFIKIQPADVEYGRYMLDTEFDRGLNSVVLGTEIAEKLLGNPERAVGKQVTIRGKSCNVIGVLKKQGSQMIGGWQFDQCVLMPYKYARTIIEEKKMLNRS